MRLEGKESNREFCKGAARVQELKPEGCSKTLMDAAENWEQGRVMLSHRRYPAPFESCKKVTWGMSHIGAITVGMVYFLAIIDPKITMKDIMAWILNVSHKLVY